MLMSKLKTALCTIALLLISNSVHAFTSDLHNPFLKIFVSDIHDAITEKALDGIFYVAPGSKGQANDILLFSHRAISEIAKENSATDRDQAPQIHFDEEKFKESFLRIKVHRNLAINVLKKASESNNKNEAHRLASEARKLIGEALHTLQDFFSHTNWVEEGLATPKFGETIKTETLLDENTPACIKNATGILADTGGKLTSGYISRSFLEGDCNPETRVQKCQHGGFLASLSCPGIAKDSPSHSRHGQAKSAAIISTERYVQNIVDFVSRGKNPTRTLCLLFNTLYDKKVCPVYVSIQEQVNVEVGADAVIRIELSEPSFFPVTVEYSTIDGTAKAGTNYEPASGSQIVFNPGETRKEIEIGIINDSICVESPTGSSLQFKVVVNRAFIEAKNNLAVTSAETVIDISAKRCECTYIAFSNSQEYYKNCDITALDGTFRYRERYRFTGYSNSGTQQSIRHSIDRRKDENAPLVTDEYTYSFYDPADTVFYSSDNPHRSGLRLHTGNLSTNYRCSLKSSPTPFGQSVWIELQLYNSQTGDITVEESYPDPFTICHSVQECEDVIYEGGFFDQCITDVFNKASYPSLRSYPGTCKKIWNHVDENGVLQKCSFPN